MKLKKDFSKMSLEALGNLTLNLQEQLSHTQKQLSHTQEQLSHTQEQLSHTQEQLSRSQAKLTEVQAKFDKSQLLIQKLKDDNDKLRAELARTKKYRPGQR
jgi:peptidoglycan hydrolase CwlO-like protein